MSDIIELLLILLSLAAGMLVGRTQWLRRGRTLSLLLDACLYALLFSMGLHIGESDAIRTQIVRVGLIAGASAAAALIGTALFVGAAAALAGRRTAALPDRPKPEGSAARARVHLKYPLRLFAAVAAGIVVGYLVPIGRESAAAGVATALLYLLVLFVGVGLARSGLDVKRALLRPRTLLVPAAAAAGSLAGGLALAPLLSLPAGKSLSVAAGFGWYSLSGVMITNLGDPVLGSAAFLSNMLREGLALLLIPALGGANRCEVAVGIAGATSMDVTLPVIARSCGPSVVPLAVANGALLSLLVPVLIPFLYRI